MPEFPPQLPARVGEAGLAAPANVISRKSQSAAEIVPTVRVREVPNTSEDINTRRFAVAPAQVRVPVIIWLALKLKGISPADDGAVNVKLVNVLAPTIAPMETVLVLDVKDKL